NIKYCRNNASDKLSFGYAGAILSGSLNAVDKGMKWIENGGFFAEFITVDAFGMMGPRTVQAYNRNKEELGHLNHKAGSEEAIREFLTGPSLFIVPISFIALSAKIFGKASKVDLKTLKQFKNLTEQAIASPKEKSLTSSFFKEIADSVYKTDKKQGAEEVINGINVTEAKDLFASQLNSLHAKTAEYDNKLAQTGFFKHLLQKLTGNENKEIKDLRIEIVKTKKDIAEHITKTNISVGNSETAGISLYNPAKVSLGENNSINISDLTDSIANYSTDILAKVENTNNKGEVLNNAQSFVEGGRKFTTAASFITLSGILYCIPMLYKQNKNFPGTDGLAQNQEKNRAVKLDRNENNHFPSQKNESVSSANMINFPKRGTN
ncbi:MAG TPA: hypothetical protein P5556_11095, partial [Candidatus Gastranaerophilales bacterium]|nr:hypothetical protein [Candidatus Gastranaerophilales bacterium]